MRFARAQKVLTFLLVIVAAAPVAISGEVSSAFAIGFAVLAIAGWFLEPPLTREPRYRRIITAAIVVLLAAQLARAVAGEPLAKMGLEFALALLGIKLMSRGNSGDYQQIVVLAFLHAIGATIATFDLSYAISFVLFAVLSPPVLALAHLRNEMERRFRHDDRPESRRALSRLLASKRVVSPRFVVATSALSLPVFAITAILFVGFPRFGLGFLGRLPSGASLGGFTEEVRIGDLSETRQEDTVTLRLEPLDHQPDRQQRLSIKLRGAAFDVYEDNTWTQSRRRTWTPLARRGNDYPLTTSSIAVIGPGYEILQEPLEPPYLFVPERTGLIRTYSVARNGLLKPRRLSVNHLGVIRYEDENKVGIRYLVYLTKSGELPNEALADVASYLVLPEGTDRLARLARQLAPDGSAVQKAHTLTRELKRRYRYADRPDLNAITDPSETPIDRFLFSRRSGTCEHFATALTLMLRAVGVPARMVTGFSSADWNPIGGYYAVRLRSAHAWTEALIDNRWVSLDATPPSERPGLFVEPSTIELVLDAARMRWHKYVVGYDASSQVEIAEQLRRLWAGSGRAGSAFDIPAWGMWSIPGGLAALIGIVWLIRRLRRRRSIASGIRRRQTPAEAEATAVYLELEQQLRSLGFERPLHSTPVEFIADLGLADLALSQASRQIVMRYNQVRFGGDSFGDGEVRHLRHVIRDLRSQSVRPSAPQLNPGSH